MSSLLEECVPSLPISQVGFTEPSFTSVRLVALFPISQVGFFPRFTDHLGSWLYCFLFPGLLIPWSLGVTSLFPGFSWSKWLLTGQLAWMLACFFLLLRAGSITLGDLSCWVVIVKFNICNRVNRVSFFLNVR